MKDTQGWCARKPRTAVLALGFVCGAGLLAATEATSWAQAAGRARTAGRAGGWEVLYAPRRAAAGIVPLPANSPLQVVEDLEIIGAHKDHPFFLAHFRAEGSWNQVQGVLRPEDGVNAALRIGRAEDFELEATLDAGGLGGWFLLFGWDQEHGYVIYNATMKQSGSPWHMTELRGGRGLESTDHEISRYDWKGPMPFRMVVADKKIRLQAGRAVIARDVELSNYHEGDIIIGAYRTRYGPKPLQIGQLRFRARPAAAAD